MNLRTVAIFGFVLCCFRVVFQPPVDAVMAVMGKNKQQFVDMIKGAIPKFKAYGMDKWTPVLEAAQQKANSSVMLFD